MKIIHVASEFAKVVKVGGLADMVYGLTKELKFLGLDVEVILPKYASCDLSHIKQLKMEKTKILSKNGKNGSFENSIWTGTIDRIPITLIEPHHKDNLFQRKEIYGFPDDIARFAYFSRAVLDFLCHTHKTVHLLHVHDWQTALIPVLYTHLFESKDFFIPGTMLTIHNLDYQGKGLKSALPLDGLENLECLEDPHDSTLINLLKGGILSANAITTVSPNYEKEIQSCAGGCGLHTLLQENKHKLVGILNGIDPQLWNPHKDPYLIYPYPAEKITSQKEISKVLHAKKHNKEHLFSLLNLKQKNKPLVSVVSRLVPQKGPELILHALRRTLEKGGQFILLGSHPTPELKSVFEALRTEFKDSSNVRILLEQDEALAHLLFASSDFLMIPSIFEPCGLTQMIALRYGTIPIARLTGGLVDTVFDIETSNKPLHLRNGFTFDFPDVQGVNWALDRALHFYLEKKEALAELLFNGMQQDFSWKHPALSYVKLYTRLADAVNEKTDHRKHNHRTR